jgi:hypothetical protein
VLDITVYMTNVVVLVRWTLGTEWVLVISIKFIGTPFCIITSLSFFLLYFGHGLSFLSFFFLFIMP